MRSPSIASSPMCAASKEPRASQVLFGGKDVLKASAGTKLRIDGELSEVLCELAKSSELFLITQTDDDEVERLVVDALETSGVFAAGMNRLHVLFCSTTAGRGSIVRQLEPDTHIDDDETVLSNLERFIGKLVCISPAGAGNSSTATVPQKVRRLSSLASYSTAVVSDKKND